MVYRSYGLEGAIVSLDEHLPLSILRSTSMRLLSYVCTLLFALAMPLFTNAGEQPFEQHAFDQAVKAGKPVTVEFHADWCGTCRAQKPVVSALLKEAKFKDLTLFVADFDRETALKQALRVSRQSTFVVFKQQREVARSTGQTDRNALDALFSHAL